MAGEIQEPFSVSFQTDSLHSGSISFGRFENEPLSWERRSSFSHNRYLEEVEKCSKPGSVKEKKAYLEAHFKKKALLLQGSSESQNGGGNQVSENDDCRDESDNIHEGSHYDHTGESGSDQVGYREDFEYGNQWSQLDYDNEQNQFYYENEQGHLDYDNEGTHYHHYDESPEGSEYLGESEVIECQTEGPGALSAEAHVEVASSIADVVEEGATEDVKPVETRQRENKYDQPLVYIQPEEIKQSLDDYVDKLDESFKTIDASPESETTREVNVTCSEDGKNLSPKVEASVECKPTKPSLKSPANSSRIQKNVSCDALKVGAKNQIRIEKESPQRMKTEKLSSKTATPSRLSLHRSPKKEDRERSNAKLNLENKRGPTVKKAAEVQPSPSKKSEPLLHQTTNSIKQTVHLAKLEKKPKGAAFSFRSDERAERRKEFYMKLEEKMHAKEAEMNQIQAKTQEKTEAEIKQFRKSLNFKAKPMPSFYHVAVTPGSNVNKTVSSKAKSDKVLHKSESPGSGATARASSVFATGSADATSIPEATGEVHCPTAESSQAGSITSTPTDSYVHSESVPENVVTCKKESSNLQKNRIPVDSKVMKDRKVEGRTKARARKSSNEMVRKNVKGSGIASGTRMGHLAVVAS